MPTITLEGVAIVIPETQDNESSNLLKIWNKYLKWPLSISIIAGATGSLVSTWLLNYSSLVKNQDTKNEIIILSSLVSSLSGFAGGISYKMIKNINNAIDREQMQEETQEQMQEETQEQMQEEIQEQIQEETTSLPSYEVACDLITPPPTYQEAIVKEEKININHENLEFQPSF